MRLSATNRLILAVLGEASTPLTSSQLADATGSTPLTVQKYATDLLRSGLITRVYIDRRVYYSIAPQQTEGGQ